LSGKNASSRQDRLAWWSAASVVIDGIVAPDPPPLNIGGSVKVEKFVPRIESEHCLIFNAPMGADEASLALTLMKQEYPDLQI
jgi:hypothetical protein